MIKISDDIFHMIQNLVRNSHKILIIGHKNPDGDALGSILGLYEILTLQGKICQPITIDQVPESMTFLPNIETIKHEFNLSDYDLVIICDSATENMTGFDESIPELFNGKLKIPVINIDHHGSNSKFGNINLVVNEVASTTILLTDLAFKLEWKINAKTSTCFLTGIYTDTGSFMHSNTDPFTLRMASKLLLKGANLRMIHKHIFKTTKISTLRLWGHVLQNMYKNENGVTVSVVTDDDFKEAGAHYSELTGVIDYVNSVPNSNFSIILTERDGNVKGSLRTLNDYIDLNEIAGKFGGGGHKKAAGFTIPGKLKKEVKWTVVN